MCYIMLYNYIEKHQKFIESAGVGVVATTVGQLMLSAYLDDKIGDDAANAVGLVTDAIIDYVGQQYVFTGGIAMETSLDIKFVLGKLITMGFSQGLFMLLISRTIRYANTIKSLSKEWSATGLRIAINIITFVALTYPLRKYWIYADQVKHD